MRVVVTGAAGFIGSHLCEHLLDNGDDVIGIDCFTDYYDPRRKHANITGLLRHERFRLERANLLTTPLPALLEGAEVVYHLAGQPGVRPSWGEDFRTYAKRNLLATQRLLEAARDIQLRKFVYASSSSVYGDAEAYPTVESVRPRPVSPYGVTKLAAEHLCELYRTTASVPTASLRLFTVYGPRQRPDMAFHRLIEAAAAGGQFFLYGDGEQTRDFTYVGDVITAMRKAATSGWTGVANIGGGSRTSMHEVVRLVSEIVKPVEIVRLPVQRGDVRHTAADTTVAREGFGYVPTVGLTDGLTRMASVHAVPAARVP
ncbi:MAG: NAD-dependent epimerase/dehydratase family protein [Actinomycetes bacterium]